MNQTATKSCQDWGDAPDTDSFFGRTQELATLEKWIVDDKCRVVVIAGIAGIGKTRLSVKLGRGGIGKTDLSLKLAHDIQAEFQYVVFRGLVNPRPVAGLILEFIKLFSDQREITLPDSLDEQILLLLQYLRQYRCLLILDNVETILEAGTYAEQYQEMYEDYSQLFQKLGEVEHRSCLIITTREKPRELERLTGKAQPVRFLELNGLDYESGKKIFTEIDNFNASENEWKELIDLYDGNPLALRLAALHIREVFFCNISKFLRSPDVKIIFDDLEKILDWHFKRLSNCEKDIVYWLAINRTVVTLADLKKDLLSTVARERLPSNIQLLQRRIPLERKSNESGFALQPVLIEFATGRLIECIIEEIKTGEIEIFNSHALLKASSPDYIRESQVQVFLASTQKRLVDVLGSKENLEICLRSIISDIQKKSPQRSGYAIGNVLNLFCHLKTNLESYDFSNLQVWQAYLQQAKLRYVNFSNCVFLNSIFIQTFGGILSLAYSQRGKYLATGDTGHRVDLWKVEGKQLLKISTYQEHSSWIWSVAFNPSDCTFASGDDQIIKLWDISTGECLRRFEGHSKTVWSIAFSPDGAMLATASGDQTVKLWDVSTGQCVRTLENYNCMVRAVAFSLHGSILAVGSDDSATRLWDINTGQCIQILEGHKGAVWSIAFPNNQYLASSSTDKSVRLWDISTGQCIQILEGHKGAVWSIAFSSDGTLLATASGDQTVKLWDVSTGQCLNTLVGHTNRVQSVAFGDDSSIIISGSIDQTIRIWNAKTGDCLATLQGYTNCVQSVVFSPDGRLLASGSDDQTIQIWDVCSGECKQVLEGHKGGVWSVAFSPDGQWLASGSGDKTVKLWRVQNTWINASQAYSSLSGHISSVGAVAFSPNSQLLASASTDGTVKLWDLRTRQCCNTLEGHLSIICSINFSSDGQWLISGSGDETAKLWDVRTGQCLKTFEGHTDVIESVAFSADDRWLASGSRDQTVKLWDVRTGQCLKTLKGHNNKVKSIAFHPNDCTLLVSSSEDGTVKFWNLETNQCLQTLETQGTWVQAVAFNHDGSRLASGSSIVVDNGEVGIIEL